MVIKQIQRPQLNSATEMDALQMNAVAFDKKHTVLTPEILEKLRSLKQSAPTPSLP